MLFRQPSGYERRNNTLFLHLRQFFLSPDEPGHGESHSYEFSTGSKRCSHSDDIEDGNDDTGEDVSPEGFWLDKIRPKRNAPLLISFSIGDMVDGRRLDLIKRIFEWDDLEYYGGFSRFMDCRDDDSVVPDYDESIDESHLEPPSPENRFVAGMRMRVEAVVRTFSREVCLATIGAVSGDRVLICFGERGNFGHDWDYWCRHDSPEIQPAGTCRRICLNINLPEIADESGTRFIGGEMWQEYAEAIGVPFAGSDLFSSLVRSETSERVLSLAEVCLRRFLSSLREDAVQSFHSDPNVFAAQLPASIRKLAQSARSCVWCGQPYLTGYKCVDAFTTQETLLDAVYCRFRTATTCSYRCGQALVYRKRSHGGCNLEVSNKKAYLYHRYFFIPPSG